MKRDRLLRMLAHIGAGTVVAILLGWRKRQTSTENPSGMAGGEFEMTAEPDNATGWDPEHPDHQHEPPMVCTEDPVDFEPGEGHTDRGELPAQIPDAED